MSDCKTVTEYLISPVFYNTLYCKTVGTHFNPCVPEGGNTAFSH